MKPESFCGLMLDELIADMIFSVEFTSLADLDAWMEAI